MQKQALAKQLTENHQSFVSYVLALSEADFTKSESGKWTAGQQLDHLYRSAKPLVLAFSLPPFIVKVAYLEKQIVLLKPTKRLYRNTKVL
jgi:hypothetical protein